MKKINSSLEIDYSILALIGLIYYVIVNVGFLVIPKKRVEATFDYFIKFVAPAQFVVLPLELILTLMVIGQWNNWFTVRQSKRILVSSGSLLLLAILEQIVGTRTLTVFDFLPFIK